MSDAFDKDNGFCKIGSHSFGKRVANEHLTFGAINCCSDSVVSGIKQLCFIEVICWNLQVEDMRIQCWGSHYSSSDPNAEQINHHHRRFGSTQER